MVDNNKCSLFPYGWSISMQKITNAVKCWIILKLISVRKQPDNLERERSSSQLGTEWSVKITCKNGAIPATRLYHTKYREFPPPSPPLHTQRERERPSTCVKYIHCKEHCIKAYVWAVTKLFLPLFVQVFAKPLGSCVGNSLENFPNFLYGTF